MTSSSQKNSEIAIRNELQNLMHKNNEVIANMHKSMMASIANINIAPILAQAVNLKNMPKIQTFDMSPILKNIKLFDDSIFAKINSSLKSFTESFKNLPPQIQAALLTLAQHGWFLDLAMPITDLWILDKALTNGRVDEAEAFLVEHYQSSLNEIEILLESRHPQRAHIIKSAIEAHRRGDYYLSIPVLLAQTDGICKDAAKQYFFIRQRNKKKPGTAAYVEALGESAFVEALLSPLTVTSPINAPESEREKDFSEMNRHMIMHGESVDYGTKENSLKTISLVNYVSGVLKEKPKDEGDSPTNDTKADL